MPDKSPIVPVSDSISKALERLFKVGGFALAFGFGGLLMTLTANFLGGDLKVPMFYAGCVLTFICLAYFVKSGARTREVAKRIKDDLPLLDGLQTIALQLTDLSAMTQSVAFKHLSTIQLGIETVMPLIEKLPVIGAAAKSSGLADATKLSAVIVSTTEGAKDTIREIEEAIRSGDLSRLREYTTKLSEAIATLRAMLKT